MLVLTTLPDLADWVRNVGGSRVEVRSLLVGGEEPHSYEPKPGDVQALARARVLVRIGLGLEDWLDGVVGNARNPHLQVITVADDVAVIHDADEHSNRSHASGNPHVWLDPTVAKNAVRLIADALSHADVAGREHYRYQAWQYQMRLDSTERTLQQVTAGLCDRRFISMHETWPYFCRRFGFVAAATIEQQPGQEVSARYLSGLARRMMAESIRVIVVEPQHNRDLADALAGETGARVVLLSSVTGGLAGAETYLRLLDYDVRTLAGALAD